MNLRGVSMDRFPLIKYWSPLFFRTDTAEENKEEKMDGGERTA